MKNPNKDGSTSIHGVESDDVVEVIPRIDLHVNNSVLKAGERAIVPVVFDLISQCDIVGEKPRGVTLIIDGERGDAGPGEQVAHLGVLSNDTRGERGANPPDLNPDGSVKTNVTTTGNIGGQHRVIDPTKNIGDDEKHDAKHDAKHDKPSKK